MIKLKKIIIIVLFCTGFLSISFAQNLKDSDSKKDITEKSDINNDDLFNEKKSKFNFKGQFKNLYTLQRINNYYGTNFLTTKKKSLVTDLKRIRLSPEFQYSDILIIHIDYDNELILSSFNKSFEFNSYWRPSQYNDFFDISWEPYYSEDILYRTKIHRAYIMVSVNYFTMIFGRQQIRFGSGNLWNPLDVLNPISPLFVEGAEEQKGTDALRLNFYPTDSIEISLIYDIKLFNNKYKDIKGDESNYVARVKATFGETDVAVLGGWVARRGLVGVDVASVLFQGILRGSLIYTHPDNEEFYFQLSTGYEYTFKEGVFLLVEYFYNGSGLNFRKKARTAMEQSVFSGINQDNYFILSNRLLTYNEHYVGIAVGYDFIPLLRGELFTMLDFQGHAMFLSPSLKYNVMENLDFQLGILFGFVFTESDYTSEFKAFEEQYLAFFSMSLYF